jgi:NADH:ubiquinone oxidoreductase subunit 5 (subunit L)/multisubunit Na+/H+ antiporter MnhA subunit
MIVNRVGDVGLAMGIAAVFFSFKTLDYPTVFACSEASANLSFSFLSYDFNRLSVICFLLF